MVSKKLNLQPFVSISDQSPVVDLVNDLDVKQIEFAIVSSETSPLKLVSRKLITTLSANMPLWQLDAPDTPVIDTNDLHSDLVPLKELFVHLNKKKIPGTIMIANGGLAGVLPIGDIATMIPDQEIGKERTLSVLPMICILCSNCQKPNFFPKKPKTGVQCQHCEAPLAL